MNLVWKIQKPRKVRKLKFEDTPKTLDEANTKYLLKHSHTRWLPEFNLRISIVGVTYYETHDVELSLFAFGDTGEECLLVDGQKTFSTTPIVYLVDWQCEVIYK